MGRIEILRGDISDPKLGLNAETYARISTSLTHAIHCAASIKLNLTIAEARTSILEGTKNVINICKPSVTKGIFKRFNHFSTMEVAGDMSGVVKEEFLTNVKRGYLNTYEQAKAETEEYLRELHEKQSFPITLYRPSMVVGDAETGQALNFQSFYYMIDDLFLNPQAPVMPGHKDFIIDTVPINFIAQAVSKLYNSDESNGHIYHLTSGMDQTLTLPQFTELLGGIIEQKTGKKLKPPHFISPRFIWILNKIAYPFTFGKVKRRIMINLIFLKFFFLRVRFDNTRTKTFMEKNGSTIPKLKDYLPTLVEYYIAHHTKSELFKK
jgi:thioester reductase-like protein